MVLSINLIYFNLDTHGLYFTALCLSELHMYLHVIGLVFPEYSDLHSRMVCIWCVRRLEWGGN